MTTEGAVVLRQCGHLLTEYEQQEILPYTEIYFLGLESQKIQASNTPGNCNYGRLFSNVLNVEMSSLVMWPTVFTIISVVISTE